MWASAISMRAFGRAEDLDIAFTSKDRPSLVTALLQHCAPDTDAAYWWGQSVGARVEAMLTLMATTEGSDSLDVQLRCASGECGQAYEVTLPLEALPCAGSGSVEVMLPGERLLLLRRPTGDDLRQWHGARHATQQEAVQAIVEDLRIDGTASPEDAHLLGEAIAAQDPLVAFSVTCACPACGLEGDVPLDLEGIALQRLAARQEGLLREVHLFATRYGWTEVQTLAVPPQRRARYRALIEDAS